MSEIDPLDQYETHSDLYDEIADRVAETRASFLSADRPVQEMMLNQAVAFALISTQTRVANHEKGYVGIMTDAELDTEDMTRVLREAGVNYCGNKAEYIWHNMVEADADRVIDHIEAEEYVNALGAVQDEFKGVAMAKGAYALAKLGVPKMACLDTHASQYLGIEDVYDGVVPEKYMAQIEQLDDLPVADELDGRFMTQWVVFDVQREQGVTTHDVWFASLPDETGIEPVGL